MKPAFLLILCVLVLYYASKNLKKLKPKPVSKPTHRQHKEFDCYVTGTFANSDVTGKSRQLILEDLDNMDIIRLKRQPDNKYDKNAILVENYNGEDLGYISKDDNAKLAAIMDAGYLTEVDLKKKYRKNKQYHIVIIVSTYQPI